jgi:hypothetical protein
MLAAISLNDPILKMFLCLCVFILLKSNDFQLCCVIFKKYLQNSGFIAATLYIETSKFSITKKLKTCFSIVGIQTQARTVVCTVAGVLDEPWSWLSQLSRVAVYMDWNRVHPM